MPSHPRLAAAAIALGCAALALTGCTAATSATSTPGASLEPTLGASASGGRALNPTKASQFAWRVVGSSKYVNGSTDVCDLSLPIVIEDASVAAGPGTDYPQYSFTIRAGQISYGTIWPTADPGTGILEGTGAYAVAYDSSGLPVSASGSTRLLWRDPSRSPVTTKRSDAVKLTFISEPRADRCSY
ncbi:MAG: hypothetical protein M3N46_13055 [Actinomycetota bacterium]|nr:hypothetical protein [Actinomycetota bacterium]